MKVLVTGGRNYDDVEAIYRVLDNLNPPITFLIEGDARGADRVAGQWANDRGVHYAKVPALWDYYNVNAGPRRNRAMLTLSPDIVVAFPGGVGTEDMKNAARKAGVPVANVSPEGNIAGWT